LLFIALASGSNNPFVSGSKGKQMIQLVVSTSKFHRTLKDGIEGKIISPLELSGWRSRRQLRHKVNLPFKGAAALGATLDLCCLFKGFSEQSCEFQGTKCLKVKC